MEGKIDAVRRERRAERIVRALGDGFVRAVLELESHVPPPRVAMNHATHGRRYCRSASRMKSATRDRDSGWQTVRRATDARSTDSGRAPAMKPVTDDGWR